MKLSNHAIKEYAPPVHVTGLKCETCGTSYEHGNVYTCPSCGDEGILNVDYDYESIASALSKRPLQNREQNIWRYSELLPVSADIGRPHLFVGWTPVYDIPRLAKAFGIRQMFLKDDGRNPTNSFKDRASSVGVLKSIEFGFGQIACASTGNAASSLAGLSAATGLNSYIFVPERAPEPKVTQLLIFGATVFRVLGSYEQAFDLCKAACEQYGWYNRNSGTNPFLVEGKKTAGLEIAEQLSGNLPDWVIVAVGDGCTIGGIGKGLQEMKRLGFIDHVPRLLGVQAEGARSIVDAFTSRKDLMASGTKTLADSIAVGRPRNWKRAIKQIRLSNGEMIAVSDDEILEAMRITARNGDVFGDPEGVAGIAGLKRAIERGIIKKTESVLCVITGNGLKDVQSANQAVGRALDVQPSLADLTQVLSNHAH